MVGQWSDLLYKFFIGISIPIIFGIYASWLSARDDIANINHTLNLQDTIDDQIFRRLGILEVWKDKGFRFTKSDGLILQAAIKDCREARATHDAKAEAYIQRIIQNGKDITENHLDIKKLQELYGYKRP